MWLASLVSNVGAWMQTVGAQWLLVHAANAAILVSLVQTADMLPDVLFAIVGGVLADILDRRRLIISVQLGLAVAGALLTAFTIAGHISPALLLMFTFIIGSGSVFITPAYQSLVPELVPREDVPSAVQLNSINVNIARAVGPAIAGIVIAHFGVGADFALNAGTFLVYALVVAFWRPPANLTPQLPERFMSALRAGGRYVRYSPIVRRILLARHPLPCAGECAVGTVAARGESPPRASARVVTGCYSARSASAPSPERRSCPSCAP